MKMPCILANALDNMQGKDTEKCSALKLLSNSNHSAIMYIIPFVYFCSFYTTEKEEQKGGYRL